jgi:hypothetical protein
MQMLLILVRKCKCVSFANANASHSQMQMRLILTPNANDSHSDRTVRFVNVNRTGRFGSGCPAPKVELISAYLRQSAKSKIDSKCYLAPKCKVENQFKSLPRGPERTKTSRSESKLASAPIILSAKTICQEFFKISRNLILQRVSTDRSKQQHPQQPLATRSNTRNNL